MRKAIIIILALAAAFSALFSCTGSFLDPNADYMKHGGFGPNPKDSGNPDNGKLLTLSGNISITPDNDVTVGTELTAVYSGRETVSYQWKKDDINVGGNSKKYTPAEKGSYTVIVSAEGYHSKTSAAVTVTGETLDLPGTITITPGANVTIGTELTAVYDGNETVSYQWQKDGVIVGTDSNKYTPTLAGSYTVTVSAAGYHSKTSAIVDVSDPSLLDFSGSITITPNSGVIAGTVLTAVYSGNEAVSLIYQWKKDGIVVGGNSNKYTPTQAGSYTVTVSAAGYNHKTSEAVNVINPLPREYTILIDLFDNVTGDTVTASPEKGAAGTTITLTYTVANTAANNQLEFGGVNAAIASVEEAGYGARTYTINAADSSNGVITITAVFTHTDLIIDHIAFNEHNDGHITKTYGDAPFTNAVTTAHSGSGLITYHSDNESVATVNGSGQVTIVSAGSAVIFAEKAADGTYAHAQTTYTLTVNPKPVTITGLSASNKTYDGTTTATVTGTAVISGKVGSDDVTVVAGTASFASAEAGNNKNVTFSGWSLSGAKAGNYTLQAQPASVTASILPDGSADAPFLVTNEADLRKVGTETTTGGWTLTAYYKQTANINMTGGNFPRIGPGSAKFKGLYNGDGYAITGLTITNSSGDTTLGLFGTIGTGGTVKNMNVTGTVTVTANSNVGVGTGGIVGHNEGGTIENCSFSGTVNGGSNYNQVGGIAGYNEGTVINSRSTATVIGRMQVGGIAGWNEGKIDNSYNTGVITGFQNVGGIAGTLTGNYIKNCYNTGDVTGTATSNTRVGGIVGMNQSSSLVEFCYNTGNVTGSNVTGSSYIGGIVGQNQSSVLRNCVSLGARITGTSNIGRVAGYNNNTLSNNTARADLKIGASGSEATVSGGAATNINGADVTVGSSTALSSVFSGWDTTIWNISGNLTAGGSLPTLKTNTQSPAPTLP